MPVASHAPVMVNRMKVSLASAILGAAAVLFTASGEAQVPAQAASLSASALAPAMLQASTVSSGSGSATLVPSSWREGPDPSTAWVFAAGFLALVVLRRVGGGSQA